MVLRLRNALVSSSLALLLLAFIAPRVRAASDTFIIRNVRIFDGTKVIPADSVIVANGQIAAVGAHLRPPAHAEIIDGRGDTLLPGLIDSHVHIWTRDVLRLGLMMGTTTELDMYMRWEEAQSWRREEAKGAFDIADFRTAGTCFAVQGGHGTEPRLPPIVPIDTASQAQAFVDERIAHGSDYIKIMYDDAPWFAAMPKDVMEAIVKAAHRRGKMVVVHVFSPQGILDVINAGADGLAHVPIARMPEPQFRDALKAHHIFVITTLEYNDFFFGSARLAAKLPADPALGPYLAPIWQLGLEAPGYSNTLHLAYADGEENLRILRDAGVPILAGTDASNGWPAGALLHTELQLMVNAGLTPSVALADATSAPAKIFGLADRGRIAPGLRADLVLVRGDPTADVRKTRDIVAVWKQGVRVDRESFREQVAQQDTAWAFGAGWQTSASPHSTVKVRTVKGGPDHSQLSMLLNGNVKLASGPIFAGATFDPAMEYPGAGDDISANPSLSFQCRGDGKTYAVTLLENAGKSSTRTFKTGKDWSTVTLPFSAFASTGRDVAQVKIGSTVSGPFHLELADARIGAHRWLGFVAVPVENGAKVSSIEDNSPAQKAGLRVGDVITRIDGKQVWSYPGILSVFEKTHIGDKLQLAIVRDGAARDIVLEVGERHA